jgi:hypothetical protein
MSTPTAMLKTKLFLAIFFLSVLSFLQSCSKSSKTDNSFENVYTQIIGPNCKGCHSPGNVPYVLDSSGLTVHPVPLDFSNQDVAYTTLTQDNSVYYNNSSCVGIPYVTADTPTKSFLLAVLGPTYNGTANFAGVTGCLPTKTHLSTTAGSLTNLSNSQITLILNWINNGAAQ